MVGLSKDDPFLETSRAELELWLPSLALASVASEEKSEPVRSAGGLPIRFITFLIGGLPLRTVFGSCSLSSLSDLKFSKSFFASSCMDLACRRVTKKYFD